MTQIIRSLPWLFCHRPPTTSPKPTSTNPATRQTPVRLCKTGSPKISVRSCKGGGRSICITIGTCERTQTRSPDAQLTPDGSDGSAGFLQFSKAPSAGLLSGRMHGACMDGQCRVKECMDGHGVNGSSVDAIQIQHGCSMQILSLWRFVQ